jgi:hypothetical protein
MLKELVLHGHFLVATSAVREGSHASSSSSSRAVEDHPHC